MPQRPSGRLRRISCFTGKTSRASTPMLARTTTAHCLQKAFPNNHKISRATPQNHESPEWAKKIATLRSKPAFSATPRVLDARSSISRMDFISLMAEMWRKETGQTFVHPELRADQDLARLPVFLAVRGVVLVA